jgi:succinate dehydrogenase/fumarate reductase flavoprotein subunit
VSSLAEHLPLNTEQVQSERERLLGLFRTEPGNGLLPAQVKHRIRAAMWEHHNYIKSEQTMERALQELQTIENDELPKMRLETDTLRFNYDWVDALDAIDMLIALKTQVSFCLFRKESRGAFYREDYPKTDNIHWLSHVVGSKGSDGKLILDKIPVDLPYAKPAEEVADFFELDY